MKKGFSKIFLIFLAMFLYCVSPVVSQERDESFRDGTMSMREARPVQIPNIDINITEPQNGHEVAFSVRLLIILTVLTIAPTLLLLLTCFLRFSIVLDFIKRALSLQQVPPTTILNGIAFFMTLFIMWPTFNSIYQNAYKPMADGKIELAQAYQQAEQPLRIFMAEQMDGNYKYIQLFMGMAKMDQPNDLSDVPTYVLIPAYILHELTIAFWIGIYLYIPFIIIDMVVASILMSMGMMMLPPVQISMPFKLMLFVLVDGWGLLIQSLFNSVL